MIGLYLGMLFLGLVELGSNNKLNKRQRAIILWIIFVGIIDILMDSGI